MIKCEYIDHMGSDLRVANAARVSFNKWKEELDDSDIKLIHYLASHQHTTPFRHPQLCVRVTAPIFVANQLKRHCVGFALNEVSRRYVDDDPQFWNPTEWRMRPDKSIKQGSSDIPMPPDIQEEIMGGYYSVIREAKNLYSSLINMGVAPEMARAVLPQSMLTSWIWTGSLHAWLHLLDLRLEAHSQKETQEFAQQAEEIIKQYFPVSLEAWNSK